MKTVVLDGYSANSGDLSWDFLGRFGEFEIYDRTPADKVTERAFDADIVVTNKTPVTAEMLPLMPKLKLVAVLATGYNIVDTVACREKGIPVTNIPSYSTNAVSQLTMSFITEFASRVGAHSDDVHSGGWAKNPDFSYHVVPTFELDGKTLGIIGFGNIGRKVAEIAKAFGMRILAMTAHPEKYRDYDVTFTDLDTLVSSSDFITLHCPMTPETDKMVNADFISKMKKTAYIINTSRGGEVDEQALADALNSDIIAGAGIDVLSTEPPKADNPMLNAKNVYFTPHIAWSTNESRERLLKLLEGNIEAFVNGNPINVVNA